MTIGLRPIEDSDVDAIFEQMRDPEAVRMAGFTAADPDDRAAFLAHLARLRGAPDVVTRVITHGEEVLGAIESFVIEGDTELILG